jgi:hypothetical protein
VTVPDLLNGQKPGFVLRARRDLDSAGVVLKHLGVHEVYAMLGLVRLALPFIELKPQLRRRAI